MKFIMDQDTSRLLKEDLDYLEKVLRRSLEGQTSKWDNMQVVIQFREDVAYNGCAASKRDSYHIYLRKGRPFVDMIGTLAHEMRHIYQSCKFGDAIFSGYVLPEVDYNKYYSHHTEKDARAFQKWYIRHAF